MDPKALFLHPLTKPSYITIACYWLIKLDWFPFWNKKFLPGRYNINHLVSIRCIEATLASVGIENWDRSNQLGQTMPRATHGLAWPTALLPHGLCWAWRKGPGAGIWGWGCTHMYKGCRSLLKTFLDPVSCDSHTLLPLRSSVSKYGRHQICSGSSLTPVFLRLRYLSTETTSLHFQDDGLADVKSLQSPGHTRV